MLGWIAIVILGLVTPQFAQRDSSVKEPSFVASIKRDNSEEPSGFGITPGRFLARNVTARLLVAAAYGVQTSQVTGGPGWVNTDRFDVEAKLEDPGNNPGKEKSTVQSLLSDRSRLLLHRDTGQASVYALVVGGSGPRLRLSPDQTSGMTPTGAVHVGPGILAGKGMRLGLVASLLGTRLGRTVLDQTELTGRYDIDLRWAPDPGESPAGPGDTSEPPDSSGPSIFTAVHQQLGLKLQSAKGPSGLLVIDHIERASTN